MNEYNCCKRDLIPVILHLHNDSSITYKYKYA